MRRIYLFVFVLFFSGCAWLLGERWTRYALQDMSIERIDQKENIKRNKLKIHGVYVSTFYDKYTDDSEWKNRSAYFVLFENGVIDGAKSSDLSLDEIIKLHDKKGVVGNPEYPAGLGVYQINGDSIIYEMWNGGDLYYVTHYEGKIIDSVTIIVENYFHNADSIFHYHPIEHKPDSIMKWFDE